jgi:hypothetical protein
VGHTHTGGDREVRRPLHGRVAGELGVSDRILSWTHQARQKGKTSGIDFDVLEKLADALGVNAALLIVHEPKGKR